MLSATQAAVTGTAAIATGLTTIDLGGVVACVANSGLTTPWSLASINTVAGGSVTVVVLAVTSGPAIAASTVATNVNVIATGQAT